MWGDKRWDFYQHVNSWLFELLAVTSTKYLDIARRSARA